MIKYDKAELPPVRARVGLQRIGVVDNLPEVSKGDEERGGA